jgi:hypothetical protein
MMGHFVDGVPASVPNMLCRPTTSAVIGMLSNYLVFKSTSASAMYSFTVITREIAVE